MGIFLLAGVAWACGAVAPHEPPAAVAAETEGAYLLLSELRWAEAREAGTTTTGWGRLARALALLNRAPKTEGSVDEAISELRALVDRPDPDGSETCALYHLARAFQIHRSPADPKRARALFERFLDRAPEHPLAGQVCVHLALLELYEWGGASPPPEVWARLERLALRVGSSLAKPAFHLVMARAGLYFGRSDEEIERHLVAALEAGPRNELVRLNALVSLGETRLRRGDREGARRAYEAFLREQPRDVRADAVRERLKEVRP